MILVIDVFVTNYPLIVKCKVAAIEHL